LATPTPCPPQQTPPAAPPARRQQQPGARAGHGAPRALRSVPACAAR